MNTTTTNTNIYGKAMLARLNISHFNPTRRDKQATSEVLVSKAASKGAAEVRKRLLPKEAIDPIVKYTRIVRADFWKHTLPWEDEGVRLLPTAAWMDFSDLMTAHQDQFSRLVDEFVKHYAQHRQQAMSQLGLLFDANDYPDVANVYQKFALRLNFMPLPKSDDFRLSLGDEDMEEISRDLDTRVDEAVREASNDLHLRLAERLKNVSERLSEPENIFRDSLIEGLRELCSLIPSLNVTGDTHLQKLTEDTLDNIARHDPQQLRDDDSLRQSTKAAADDILRKLGVAL